MSESYVLLELCKLGILLLLEIVRYCPTEGKDEEMRQTQIQAKKLEEASLMKESIIESKKEEASSVKMKNEKRENEKFKF